MKLLKTLAVVIPTFLSATTMADYELEPNNTREDANVVASGTSVTGQLSGREEDWFRIQATGPDILTVTANAVSNSIDIDIYDEDGNTLYVDRYFPTDDSLSVGIRNAGNYYIKIHESGVNNYEITATFESSPPSCSIDSTVTLATSTAAHANYENGALHIPYLDVAVGFGGTITYAVDMELVPFSNPMSFKLTGITPAQ